MRTGFAAILALLLASACDSSSAGESGPSTDPNSPSGTFTVESIWFRHSMRVSAGAVEDLQAWIDGKVTFSVDDTRLSGSGTCTVRRRRHKSWLGDTSDITTSQAFSASGTLSNGVVQLTLTGCAWAMTQYQGSFSDGDYALRVRDAQTAPVWDPDIWRLAIFQDGDDPLDLVFRR